MTESAGVWGPSCQEQMGCSLGLRVYRSEHLTGIRNSTVMDPDENGSLTAAINPVVEGQVENIGQTGSNLFSRLHFGNPSDEASTNSPMFSCLLNTLWGICLDVQKPTQQSTREAPI